MYGLYDIDSADSKSLQKLWLFYAIFVCVGKQSSGSFILNHPHKKGTKFRGDAQASVSSMQSWPNQRHPGQQLDFKVATTIPRRDIQWSNARSRCFLAGSNHVG